MALELCLATAADAGRIAEIHMAAFGANAMLRAQFPTPEVRRALQLSIEEKALADIEDPKISVVVVRASAEPVETIAFAKWSHPVQADEVYTETPWTWPKGTDLAVLEDWTAKMEAAEKEVLGGTPCYRTLACLCRHAYVLCSADIGMLGLTFIGTDPRYLRQGAATKLVSWGIQRSRAEQVPLYLESTMEAAAFYSSLGFIERKYVSMELKAPDESHEIETYTEAIFVFR